MHMSTPIGIISLTPIKSGDKNMNKKLLIPCACVSAILLGAWIGWGNFALTAEPYRIKSDDLPEAFDGFRIAHISDMHNSRLAKDDGKLIRLLEQASPDLIAITGDLIDARRTDTKLALSFMEEALKIAPCYYVPGNHEARIEEYPGFAEELERIGVEILYDESTVIERGGEFISIIGLADPAFHSRTGSASGKAVLSEHLYSLTGDDAHSFTLLLSHRPEIIDIYSSCGVDLALCGHAHGGQIRLPFIGGIIAPHQGWFPRFDAGLFKQEETSMLVSRGVGNSLFPFRVNNSPEVPIIELVKA